MPTNRERITINLTAAEVADLAPHLEAVRQKLGREQLTLAAFIHQEISDRFGLNWPLPERGRIKGKPQTRRAR